jgi:hypothetical protein
MSKIDEDIPLLCVCGNHDVGNTPNKVTLERYRNDFGDDYFSFSVRGVRGIVINSNLYYDPSEVCVVCVCVCFSLSLCAYVSQKSDEFFYPFHLLLAHSLSLSHTHKTQAQEEYTHQHTWLETQLKAAKDDGATHTLLFTHHPLFLQTDDEGEDVSVLGSSSFITHRGEEVSIPNTYFHIPRYTPTLSLSPSSLSLLMHTHTLTHTPTHPHTHTHPQREEGEGFGAHAQIWEQVCVYVYVCMCMYIVSERDEVCF